MAKKPVKLSPLHKDLLAQRATLIQSEAEVAAQVAKAAAGLLAKWKKLIGKLKAGQVTPASIADTTRLGYVLRELGKVTDAEVGSIEKFASKLYQQTFKEESARYRFAFNKFGLQASAGTGYSLHALSGKALATAGTNTLPGMAMYQSFRALSATAKKRMQEDVVDAIASGWSPTALARKWSAGAGAGRLFNDATTLARTSLMAASNQAMVAQARAMPGTIVGLRWEATFDVRTCVVCGGRHGKVYPMSALPPMPAHPNCVLPDTEVLTGSRMAATRAWYSGNVVSVRTKSGRKLTITAKHPVLTAKGYKPASMLDQSDYLVCNRGNDRAAGGVEDREYEPATAKQAFDFDLIRGSLGSPSVPAAAAHFHGDAASFEGDVDVVVVNRELFRELESRVRQPSCDCGFQTTGIGNGSLPPLRDLDSMLLSLRFAAYGRVSSSRESRSLFGRSVGHPDVHRLAAVALADPGLAEPPNDCAAINVELLGECFNRYAGIVELDQVSSVETYEWSGHVYDFQTASGGYTANGIIVHNCRCVWIPVFADAGLNSALGEVTPYPAPAPSAILGGQRDFEKWLDGQTTGQQLDFFGSELKQRSWATGKLSLEEMASPTGRVVTDAELLAKYPIKPVSVTVSMSANTGKVPELADLNAKAAAGDDAARRKLQNVARDELRALLADIKSATISNTPVVGLYGGEFEASIAPRVSFMPRDRAKVMQRLTRFADAFQQEEIHVLGDAGGKGIGYRFKDGSYNTVRYQIQLKRELTRAEAESHISASGLYGASVSKGEISAYFVGAADDAQAIAEFKSGIKKLQQSLGEDGGTAQYRAARLWRYGRGSEGTIDFGTVRGGAGSATGAATQAGRKILAGALEPATSFAGSGSLAGLAADSVTESTGSGLRAAVLKAAKDFQPQIDNATAAVAKAKKEIASLRDSGASKAEVSKAITRYQQAKVKVIERKEEAAKVARSALRVANPMKVGYSVEDPVLVRSSGAAISSAMDFVGSVVDAKSIESVNVKIKEVIGGRDYHRPGELNMSLLSGSNTYVHELAHEIEQKAGWVEKSREFILSRSKGEALQEMSALDPKGGYGKGELAFKDKFKNAYMGRWYSTGKATEVVSMGMQWLYEDAAGFAKADPEYFDFVTKLMRGATGKAVTGASKSFTAMGVTYNAEDLLALAKKIVAGEDPVALTQGMNQQQLAKLKQKVATQKILAKSHGTITMSAEQLLAAAKQVVAGVDLKVATKGMTTAEIEKVKKKVGMQKWAAKKKMTLTAPEIEAQKVAAQIGKMTPAESAALDAKLKADELYAANQAKWKAEEEAKQAHYDAQAANLKAIDAELKAAQEAAAKYHADDLKKIAIEIDSGMSFNDATFGMSKFQIEEVKNHLKDLQTAMTEFATEAKKPTAPVQGDTLAMAKAVLAGKLDIAEATAGMTPEQTFKFKKKVAAQKHAAKKKTGMGALPKLPQIAPKVNLIPEPGPVDYGAMVSGAPQFPSAAIAGTEGVPTVIDASKFKRIGEQKGSNPGGMYEDHAGIKWYVKTPADLENARNEVLANKLYNAVGVDVPEVHLAVLDGKVGVASRVVDLQKVSPDVLKTAAGVKEGFAVDAWLANWDVVGQDYDNLAIAKSTGSAVRIDTGGALRFRTKGKLKGAAFTNAVGELQSFLSGTNPQSSAVFGGIADAEIFKGIDKVAAITPTRIETLVNTYGPVNPIERAELTNKLLLRRQNLLEWRKARIAELNAEAVANAVPGGKRYKTIKDATQREQSGLKWWVSSGSNSTLFHLYESPEADWRREQVIAGGHFRDHASIQHAIKNAEDKLKGLESLLKKSPKLAKPETLWRSIGVRDDFYNRVVTKWIADGEWTADFTQSASRSRSHGTGFGLGDQRIVFQFEGTVQALDMDKFAGGATGGPIYEAELFITKGSRFEITKVEKAGRLTTIHLKDKPPNAGV